MSDLEKLIIDTLSKFPAENARIVVANKLKISVEELFVKMNDKAFRSRFDFPAEDFMLIDDFSIKEDQNFKPSIKFHLEKL